MPSVSYSSFQLLECGYRYLKERFLGHNGDNRWRVFGKVVHKVAEEINNGLMRNEPLSPEDIKESLLKMVSEGVHFDDGTIASLGPLEASRAEEGLLWYAERMEGATPISVEQKWTLDIANTIWGGRFDMVRMHPENGALIIDELKSGYIPTKEEAKRSLQNNIYAMAGYAIHRPNKLIVNMVSIGNRFSIMTEYDANDMDRLRPYLSACGKPIAEAHEQIKQAKETGGVEAVEALAGKPPFHSNINPFCHSCVVKGECNAYKSMLVDPDIKFNEEQVSVIEGTQQIKVKSNLLERAYKQHKEILVGMLPPSGILRVDGWTVRQVVSERQYSARPASTVTIKELVMEKEHPCNDTASVPENTQSGVSATSPEGGKPKRGRGRPKGSTASATPAVSAKRRGRPVGSVGR